MTEAQYEAKFQEMQKHIPFIQKVIEKLKVNNDQQGDNPRKAQLQKMEMLHELLTNRTKKLKMETLMKCEGVLIKLHAKIEKHSTFLQNEDPLLKSAGGLKHKDSSLTPTSTSPATTSEAVKCKPNDKAIVSARIVDADDIQPVVIPTERRDTPNERIDKETRPSSAGDKAKDHKQKNNDHQRQPVVIPIERRDSPIEVIGKETRPSSAGDKAKDHKQKHNGHQRQPVVIPIERRDSPIEVIDKETRPSSAADKSKNDKQKPNDHQRQPVVIPIERQDSPIEVIGKETRPSSAGDKAKDHKQKHNDHQRQPVVIPIERRDSPIEVIGKETRPSSAGDKAKDHKQKHNDHQRKPVVIPIERRDSPIEVIDKETRPSSGADKSKDHKQKHNDHQRQHAPPQNQHSHQHSKNSPQLEEIRKFQSGRDVSLQNVDRNEKRSTPPNLHHPRATTSSYSNNPLVQLIPLPPTQRSAAKDIPQCSSSKVHPTSSKKDLLSSSMPSKSSSLPSKSNTPQMVQTVKVVITEPLPANIAIQHFPPHHQYLYQQHSPEPREHQRFINNIEILPQPMTPPLIPKINSASDEEYNPDECWEEYNEALKNSKNKPSSGTKTIFSRLGDKVVEEDASLLGASPPKPSTPITIPTRTNTPIPEVLKSPPLSATDISKLLIDSGGDQFTSDISQIGTRRAKKPDVNESKSSLDFVRRKFAQIAKINTPQTGESVSPPSSAEVKIEEKLICSTTAKLSPMPIERLALKYNPHQRHERLQSLSSNDGSECSQQSSTRVGASPKDPRLKLKMHIPPSAALSLPAGVNVLPAINNNDPRLKKMMNDSLPKPSIVIPPSPPIPANVFGVRNDPRLLRQQQFQQSPVRRMSISQPYATTEEKLYSDSTATSMQQQSPVIKTSKTQTCVSPEENWDSDPEEPKKINNDILPKPSAVISSPSPKPANIFGVRNDPRLSRQQQSEATVQKTQLTPVRRMSISQPYTTPEENWDYNSPATSMQQQAPLRRPSISQPYISPEENWDSDPEECTKIYSRFGSGEMQRQLSASVSVSLPREVPPAATRGYHCNSNARDIDFDSRPKVPITVPQKDTKSDRNINLVCPPYSILNQHPPAPYLANPYVKRTSVPLTIPPVLPPSIPPFMPVATGAQVSSRLNSALNDNTERMKYFDARQQKPHGPRTYKEHKEAREDEFNRRALDSQKQLQKEIGYMEAAKKKFSEKKVKKYQEHEKAKNKIQTPLSKLEEKRTGVIKDTDQLKNKDSAKDKDQAKNSAKVVAAESTLDKMYRTQNFNAQYPKATLSFKIPKKKTEEPKSAMASQDTIKKTLNKTDEKKPLQSFSKSVNNSKEKTDKNESSKKTAGQKTTLSKTIGDKSQKLRVDTPKPVDSKESEQHDTEVVDTSIEKPINIRDPRCKKKETQELSSNEKNAPVSSKVKNENTNTKAVIEETKPTVSLSKKDVEMEKTGSNTNKKDIEEIKKDFKFDAKKSFDTENILNAFSTVSAEFKPHNENSLNAFSAVSPEFKPQRILRRRCTMVAIGSAPLVDKDKLLKANALMLEDIEEREKLKRKKEEEERQTARRNKHLSEMFQKTDDNCSVSTQNIITGKRRTRASINFNETQNALKIFKHMTMKDTSATTPLISPAVTTKSSKKIRSTRASGDIRISTENLNEKDDGSSRGNNDEDLVADNSGDMKKDAIKKDQEASEVANSQSKLDKIKDASKIISDKDDRVKNKKGHDEGVIGTKNLNLGEDDTGDEEDKSLVSKNNIKVVYDKQGQNEDSNDLNNEFNDSKKQEALSAKQKKQENPKTKPVVKKGNKQETAMAIKKTAEEIKKQDEEKIQGKTPVLANSSKPLEVEHQNCAVSSTSAEILPIEEAPSTSTAARRLKAESDDNEPSSTGSKSSNPTPTPAEDESSGHVFLNEFVQEIIKPNADKQHILSLLGQILSEDKLQFIKTVIDSSNKNKDKETEGNAETIDKKSGKGEIPIGNNNKSKDTDKVKKNEESDEEGEEDGEVARDHEDGAGPPRLKKISKNDRATPVVRRKRNELDRLNEDIRDMFICEGVLTATGKRMCTLMQTNDKKEIESENPGNKINSQSTSSPETKTEVDAICGVKKKVGRPKKLVAQPLRRSLRACKISETSLNDSVNDDEVEVTSYNDLEDNSDTTPTRRKMPVLKPHTPIRLPEELDIQVSADTSDNKRKSTTKPCPKSKKTKALKPDEQNDDSETSSDSQIESDSDTDEEDAIGSKLETIKNTKVHWHNQSKYTSWCALCSKKILAVSSSFHYKLHHGENFISRLAPTLLQKFKQGKLSQPIFGVDRSPRQASWFHRCPFCLQYFNTPMPLWLEHFQNHTAEFRYECSKCHWGSNRIATTRRHISGNCKGAKIDNSTVKLVKPSEIKAHVCHLCNFVQLKRANLERHYVEQHLLAIKHVDILGYTITLFDIEEVELVPEDKAQVKEEEIRKDIETQERIIELEDEKEDEGNNNRNDGVAKTLEKAVLKIKVEKSDADTKEKQTANIEVPNSSQQTKEQTEVTNTDVGPNKGLPVRATKLIKPQSPEEEATMKDMIEIISPTIQPTGETATDKTLPKKSSIADSVESEVNETDGTSIQVSLETVPHAKKDNEIEVTEKVETSTYTKKTQCEEDKLPQQGKAAKAISKNKQPLWVVNVKPNQSKKTTPQPNQSKKTVKTTPQPNKTDKTNAENKMSKAKVKIVQHKKPPTEDGKEPEGKSQLKNTGKTTPQEVSSLSEDVTMAEVKLSEPGKTVKSAMEKKTLSDISEANALKMQQEDKATLHKKTQSEELKDQLALEEKLASSIPQKNTSSKESTQSNLQGEKCKQTDTTLSVKSDMQKETVSDISEENSLKMQQVDKETLHKKAQSEGVKDQLALEEKLASSSLQNNTSSEESTQSNLQSEKCKQTDTTLLAPEESAIVIQKKKLSIENVNQSDVEMPQSTKTAPKKAAPSKEPTQQSQLTLPLQEDGIKSSQNKVLSSEEIKHTETIIPKKLLSERDVPSPTNVLKTTPTQKLPSEDPHQVKVKKTTIPTPTKIASTNDVEQPRVSFQLSINKADITPKKFISSRDTNASEKDITAAVTTTPSNLNSKEILSNTNIVISKTVAPATDSNIKILSPKFNAGLVTATYSKKKDMPIANTPAVDTKQSEGSVSDKSEASKPVFQLEESKDDCVIVNTDISYRYLQDELLTLAAQVAEEEETQEKECIILDPLEVYTESESKIPNTLEVHPASETKTTDPLEISPHSTESQSSNENLRSNTKMSDLISESVDMFYQQNKRKSVEIETPSITKKVCLNQNPMPATPNAFVPTTLLGRVDSPPIQILAQSIISIDPIEPNDRNVGEKPQTTSIAERLSQRFKILQQKAKGLSSVSKPIEEGNDSVNSCSIEMTKLNTDDKKTTDIVESSKTAETNKSFPILGEVTVISDDEDWEDIEITESAPNPVPSNNLQKSKNKGLFQKFGLFKGNSTKAKKNMTPMVFMPKKKTKDKQPSASSPITAKPSTSDKLNTATVSSPTVHLGFKPVNIEDLLPDSPCNDPIDLVPELTPLVPLTDLNDISSILDCNLSINMDESHTCIQDALDFICEQQAHEQQSQKPSTGEKAQVQTKFHKNKIQHVGYSLQSQQTNNIKFYCLLENCSFLFSSDAVGLENHFLCEHSETKWNGFCCICQTHCLDNDKEYSIVNEIKHMVDSHVSGTSVVETNSNDSSQHSTTANQVSEERPRIKLRRMTGDCLSTSNSECSTPCAATVASTAAAAATSSVFSVAVPSTSNTLLGALLNAKQKPPTKEMPPQPEMPLTEPLLMENGTSSAFTSFGNDFHITSVCSGVDSAMATVQKESTLQIASVVSLNKPQEEPTNSVVPQRKASTSAQNIGNLWSQQIEQEKQDLIESAAASLEVSAIMANAGKPSIRRESSHSRDDSPGPLIVSETVPVTQEKRGDFVITQTVSAQYDEYASTAVGFNISIEVPPVGYSATMPSAVRCQNESPPLPLHIISKGNNSQTICDEDSRHSLDGFNISHNSPVDSIESTPPITSCHSLGGFNVSHTSPVDSIVSTPHITSRQYKCMAQGCKFTSRVPVAMSDHLRFHERRNFSSNRDYFDCAFCNYQADEVDDYMKHSDKYHIISKGNKLVTNDLDAIPSTSLLRGNICDILSKKMETTAQRNLAALREAQRTSLIKQKESEQDYLRKLKITIEEIVGPTGFSDDKLYRCVIKNCPTKLTEATFHNHIMYHISTLGIANPNNHVFKCPHCTAQYHRPAGIKAHIKSHACNRYFCYMCDVTSSNPGQMMKHFSEKHWHTMNMYTKELLKPKVSLSTDGSEKIYDSGYYITYSSELSDAEVRKYGEKLILEWQRKKSGSKTHFKSSEMDLLPIQPIFQREVNCGECEYKTKVRTNMYRHLSMHKQYAQQPHTTHQTLVASVDPVNPVPCLNSNERFFDKMTNLASSSLIPSISANATSSKAAYKLPHVFISDENRYKCGVPNCNYITISEDIFRSHLTLNHSASLIFRCPFCQEEICKRGVSVDRVINHLRFHSSILHRCDECNYVHHLRFVVERHVNDKHATMKVNIVRHERTDEVGEGTMTITNFAGKKYKEPTDADQQLAASASTSSAANATRSSINADTTTKSSNSSSTAIAKSKAKWICDLCNHIASSLNVIQLHCQNIHGQNKQYQCMHCNFGSHQLSQILYHIDEKHSGKAREARNIYHKSINSNEVDVADTRPLWQRNDPTRVRHIRGILMEDEEESEKYRKKMGLDKVVDDEEEEEDYDKVVSNESNLSNFLKGYEFGCFHCDYKTQQFDELSSVHHKTTHSDFPETSKPFMFRLLRRVCCSECRKFTGNFYELQLHLLNTHNVRNYYAADLSVAENDDASLRLLCAYCSYNCLKTEQLIKHFQNPKVQHSPQDVCIENDLQIMDVIAMGSKQTFFRCTLCSELLPDRISIVHHATNLHDNEEAFSFRELTNTLIYHCALCSYTATTESVLLRHMIDHYGRFKRCHFCHETQVSFEGYMQHCYAEHREDIRKFRELYQYTEIRKFLLQMFILFPNGLIISKRNLMRTNTYGEHAIAEFYEEIYKISQQPPIPRLSIARLVARKSIESYHKQISVGSPPHPKSNDEDNICANPSPSPVPTATLCAASVQAKKISKRRSTVAIGQDDEYGGSVSSIAAKNNKSSSNKKKKQSLVADYDSSSNQSSEFNIPLAHAMLIKKRRRTLASDSNSAQTLASADEEDIKNICKKLKTDNDDSSNEEKSQLDVEYYSYYGIKPEPIDLSKIYTKVAIGGINTPLSLHKFRHLFNIDCKLRLTKCDVSNTSSYKQYNHIKKACPASHKIRYSRTEHEKL